MMLRGNKVYLANLFDGDAEYLTDWQWDDQFLLGLSEDVVHPYGVKEWSEFFGDANSNSDIMFTIRRTNDDMLVGFAGISDIMLRNQRGELCIGIPQAGDRSLGYGREAFSLLLEYAFDHLNLHKVTLTVHAYNTAALKLYEKCGFVREGTNREAVYHQGKWYDSYSYGLLAREWRQNPDNY
ncbi:GNAT family N-acetyltransferase [Periweissella fabalis]|uniref:GNAT family N-acetyltransferase n=1 Tax=Periweissella fabalis TaxID=1070421 RepID=A0A7X6N1Z6_9LACO|nr:GNAT family protein [Periweissella fabalis]MCM0599331.1 GNAT family N-acetyltransferase [Periweissella fabalis]NKZ23610.1 GNAT family N-acetyltransferase [Periweissella fabalis]